MSELKVKGKVVDGELVYTCPVCNQENHDGISKVARRYVEGHNISSVFKHLCKMCPKGVATWLMVETEK